MPFDAFSISLLTRELNDNLANGRIGKIFQPDQETVIITVFHPFPRRELNLLISVHPRFFRTHLVTDRPGNPLQPPAFCMLLRKYLQGGRILRLEQPSWERMINFQIEVYDTEEGLTTYALVFEAMGRSSNLLLVNGEGMILDALKRLPATPRREREIIPGKPYTPPPVPGLYHPGNITLTALERIFQLSPSTHHVTMVLSRELFGLSRPLQQEILKKAGVPETLTVKEVTPDLLRQLYAEIDALNKQTTGKAFPFIQLDPSDCPQDFFPYQPSLPAESLRSVPDLNSAIVLTLHEQSQLALRQQKAEQLKMVLRKATKKAEKKQNKQRQELAGADDADTYRLYGELISVHLSTIKRGQTQLVAANYYDPHGATVTIALDSALSPVENSQLYYKKYHKAKKGQTKIRAQLERTAMELDYYASLDNALENLSSWADLMEIETEMVEAGLLKSTHKHKKLSSAKPKNQPSLFKADDDWEILVGRNNKQNDQLTMKTATAHDLWLHTQKIPGSHVIIRTQGRPVPSAVLLEAANLAVYFSKACGSSKVPVDYTEKRHLRKPTGAPPGFVLYEQYQTIIIDPDPQVIARYGLKDLSKK